MLTVTMKVPSRRWSCASDRLSTVMTDRLGKLAHLLPGFEWRKDDKFLAAIATDRGPVFADRVLESVANGNEAFVAFLVTVTVIVLLEEVDIDQEDGEAFSLLAPIIQSRRS